MYFFMHPFSMHDYILDVWNTFLDCQSFVLSSNEVSATLSLLQMHDTN